MTDDPHPLVIELTDEDGVPIAAPDRRPAPGRLRLLLAFGAGALVLVLAVALTGYLLLRRHLTDFATGTWDCTSSDTSGESGATGVRFVAVITDSTFTLSAGDSDDPLSGTWRLSGTHVVLHADTTTPGPSQVEVTDIPRWLTDSSYDVSGSDGRNRMRLHVTVTDRHRRVRISAGQGDGILCVKR